MAITTGDNNLNSVAASQKQTLSTNYLDLASTANQGWAQQYVPDLMEKEAEVFGNRTISGFLSQIGAEEPMSADQVVWSEQSRLHLSYKGNVSQATSGLDSSSQFTIESDIDDNTDVTSKHGVRVNDTIVLSGPTNGVVKCLVVKVNGAVLDIAPYGAAALSQQLFLFMDLNLVKEQNIFRKLEHLVKLMQEVQMRLYLKVLTINQLY